MESSCYHNGFLNIRLANYRSIRRTRDQTRPIGMNHQNVSANRGMTVLSRILGTMVLMALPAIGAWYLDRYLRTGFLLWIGIAIGLVIGCVGLFLIVKLAALEMNQELHDGRKFQKLEDPDEPAE